MGCINHCVRSHTPHSGTQDGTSIIVVRNRNLSALVETLLRQELSVVLSHSEQATQVGKWPAFDDDCGRWNEHHCSVSQLELQFQTYRPRARDGNAHIHELRQVDDNPLEFNVCGSLWLVSPSKSRVRCPESDTGFGHAISSDRVAVILMKNLR